MVYDDSEANNVADLSGMVNVQMQDDAISSLIAKSSERRTYSFRHLVL